MEDVNLNTATNNGAQWSLARSRTSEEGRSKLQQRPRTARQNDVAGLSASPQRSASPERKTPTTSVREQMQQLAQKVEALRRGESPAAAVSEAREEGQEAGSRQKARAASEIRLPLRRRKLRHCDAGNDAIRLPVATDVSTGAAPPATQWTPRTTLFEHRN